jgi:hypothetical protein
MMVFPGKEGRPTSERFHFPAVNLSAPPDSVDLGLQVCRLRFRRSMNTGVGVTAGTAGGGFGLSNEKLLIVDGQFVFWDYRAERPVGYGRFTEAAKFNFVMTRTDWYEVMWEIASLVINNTPLRFSEARNPWEQAAKPLPSGPSNRKP